ncbi:RagB/SusD family nutrient uptake outer membrane protein [Parapedobacter sp. SGR-10]|uniref:RagB/SusD family nutrient uptake outer membrane protein n=1 Tax=Parapedobacter sp. SGR-10 TaxID=2710879 RepID=UPI0013D0F961|nr:RagB/SusD family nutrient uptake outer membrane protein [Parapedobacter sp. SGR-10]NGF56417.1 RagB/SusD family nutrient uptake outer membrane protein [Parapedobacter sp. SGR-10]
MKRILYIFFIIPFVTGCGDFLDPDPTDRLSDKLFWVKESSTDLYLNSLYTYIPSYGNFGTAQFNDGLLTEGMTGMLKYGSYSAGGGNANRIVLDPYFVTADQSQGLVIWTKSYERIRRVNEFISSMKKYATYADDIKNRYEAQARFLRAFLYYQLLLRTNTVVLYDDLPTSNNKPLSSEAECWDFVENDLNFAAQHLPVKWSADQNGRITKGAAFALKSRAMLVAKRWEKARNAAKEVINLTDNGAKVYDLNPSYKDAFRSYFNGNPESILEFRYQLPAPTHTFDRKFAPAGDWANNGGAACPTQEMVEEYELAIGGKADWSAWRGRTTETPPYDQLEPRFHASILYNGASWKGRQIESFVDGRDGFMEYGFQPNTFGKTTTGYYLRKYLNEGIADISTTYSDQPWIEIRLAEVYLNLAEACYRIGETGDANDAIEKIRGRVNLPYSDKTGDDLFEAIRHERKVELAFEGFHYWDLRRWRVAHEELHNVRFHGLKITKSGTILTYEYVDVDKADRKFLERFYNFPIPVAEIANNTSLSQINLW